MPHWMKACIEEYKIKISELDKTSPYYEIMKVSLENLIEYAEKRIKEDEED